MKKMIYGGLLSVFLVSNSVMAMIENSATGIQKILSEVQPLRNGALMEAVLKKVNAITSDSILDDNSKVVFLDVLNRHTGVYSSQSSLLILQKIKEIVKETFDSEGYGTYLWNWMYDSTSKDIISDRYDIDVIRSMISKLNGTAVFESTITPILIKRGLEYYIPPKSNPEQFQWPK